jgi:hypothetical protein
VEEQLVNTLLHFREGVRALSDLQRRPCAVLPSEASSATAARKASRDSRAASSTRRCEERFTSVKTCQRRRRQCLCPDEVCSDPGTHQSSTEAITSSGCGFTHVFDDADMYIVFASPFGIAKIQVIQIQAAAMRRFENNTILRTTPDPRIMKATSNLFSSFYALCWPMLHPSRAHHCLQTATGSPGETAAHAQAVAEDSLQLKPGAFSTTRRLIAAL